MKSVLQSPQRLAFKFVLLFGIASLVAGVGAFGILSKISAPIAPEEKATNAPAPAIQTAVPDQTKPRYISPSPALQPKAPVSAEPVALVKPATAEDESAALQGTIASQQQRIEALNRTIARLTGLQENTSATSPKATYVDADDPDTPDDHTGRRDPRMLFSPAEVETAVIEATSLVDTAIAQGGYTSVDEQRFMEIRKYLPQELLAQLDRKFLIARSTGRLRKFD